VLSRDLLLNSATAYISRERLQLEFCAGSVCGAFDAAFAKLLWPLVVISYNKQHLDIISAMESFLDVQPGCCWLTRLLSHCQFYALFITHPHFTRSTTTRDFWLNCLSVNHWSDWT